MPRINGARSIEAERNVAQRIRIAREDRGWSPAQLAQRMTEAGCSISTSAIYKIEDAEKPRKITVDELVALGAVFDIDDLRDLLRPVEELYQERADAIFSEIGGADQDLAAALYKRVNGLVAFFELHADRGRRDGLGRDSGNEQDAIDYVNNMLKARSPRKPEGSPPEPLFYAYDDDGNPLAVSDEPLRQAVQELLAATAWVAGDLVAAQIDRRKSNG